MSRRLTKILISASVVVCLCGVATGLLVWRFVFPRIAKDFRAWQAKQRAYEAADRLKRDMDSRKLLVPAETIPGFPSEAIVVFVYQGWQQEGATVNWPKVGFAIGDGTLILTAAHCVEELDEKSRQAVSWETFVISPYYGGVFDFKVLAVDKEADLAILQASWPSHPALALASQAELEAAKQILVTGYPAPDEGERPYRIATEVRMEQLPVSWLGERHKNTAIGLRAARFGRPGWSGSALVLPERGKVAGVLTILTLQTNSGVLVRRDLSGCSVKSIHAALEQHRLTNSAYANPSPTPPIENAREGFSLAVRYMESWWNRDFFGAVLASKKLVELRPDSGIARLLLAQSAHNALAFGESNAAPHDLAIIEETNFPAAVHLSPGSAPAHAGYGNFLMFRERYDEALAEIEAALAIEPRNELALVNRLRILTRTSPQKAAEFGQELTEKHPDNAHFWFWFSEALTQVGRHEPALDAAQQAVKLNPDGVYRGRLADALAQLGRLDDAEKQFKKMTADCGCQACWVRHANFLLDHREEKVEEARKSVETAESKTRRRVSEANLKNLRIKLDLELELAPLRLLAKKSPKEAETLGRQMVHNSTTNGHYWFEMAGILRTLGKHEEAVAAAQRAVDLSPDASYQPRLADTLAKAGRLDESEQTYKQMLRDHPDRPKCWLWYAEFLHDYHPQRIEDARAAFAKAQSPSPNWSVPAGELESLRVKLESEKATTKPPESGAR